MRDLTVHLLTPNEASTLGGPDDPPGLRRLSLGGGVDARLLRALADSPLALRLTALDLSVVDLSPEAVATLTSEPGFSSLRKLGFADIFRSHSKRGFVAALVNSPVLTRLTDLSIESARLTDGDARLLAQAPHLLNLERLEFWHNRIGAAGVRAFVEGPDRPRLTHFSFGYNRLGDEGASALAAWTGLKRFRRLDLRNNKANAAVVEALARDGMLDEVGGVRLTDGGPDLDFEVLHTGHLCVNNNGLTEHGVSALLRSPHRGRLDHLELWSKALARDPKVHQRLREFLTGDVRLC